MAWILVSDFFLRELTNFGHQATGFHMIPRYCSKDYRHDKSSAIWMIKVIGQAEKSMETSFRVELKTISAFAVATIAKRVLIKSMGSLKYPLPYKAFWNDGLPIGRTRSIL